MPAGRFISFSNSSHPDGGFLYVASTPPASWKSPLCEPLALTSLKAVLDQIAKTFPNDPRWATYQDAITTLRKTNPSRGEYVEALEGMVDALLREKVQPNTATTAPTDTPNTKNPEKKEGWQGRSEDSSDDLTDTALTPNDNTILNSPSHPPTPQQDSHKEKRVPRFHGRL